MAGIHTELTYFKSYLKKKNRANKKIQVLYGKYNVSCMYERLFYMYATIVHGLKSE